MQKKLKILLFEMSDCCPTIPLVYNDYLAKRGHEIFALVDFHKSRTIGKEYWGDVKTINMPHPSYSKFKFPLLKTIENRMKISLYISRKIMVAPKISRLCRQENFDIIQVRDSLFDALVALYLSKKFRTKFIFHLSALLNEREIFLHRYNIIKRLYNKLEIALRRFIIRKSHLFIVNSDKMKSYFLEKGFEKNKMVSLPEGVNKIFLKYPITKKWENTLVYVGAQRSIRRLNLMLEAVAKAKQKIKSIKLLVAGKTNEDLVKKVEELGLKDNVYFLGPIKHHKLPESISKCAVGLIWLPDLYFFKVSSVVKTAEYMSLGIPFVATNTADAPLIIKESGAGVTVDYDTEEFANAIIFLLENPRIAENMGKKGRGYVKKKRNSLALGKKIEATYYNKCGFL